MATLGRFLLCRVNVSMFAPPRFGSGRWARRRSVSVLCCPTSISGGAQCLVRSGSRGVTKQHLRFEKKREARFFRAISVQSAHESRDIGLTCTTGLDI